VIALVLPSLITWGYFFQADAASPRVQLIAYNVAKVTQFLLPVAWVYGIRRRRPPHAASTPAPGSWGWAVAFGAVVGAAMLALYGLWIADSAWFAPAAAQIRAKITGFGIDSAAKYLALGVFYSLLHSLLEEYYWRWFVFGELRRSLAVGAAIAISSLGFMAHHVLVLGKFFGFAAPVTWLFALCVAVGGAFWAWLYQRSGSLKAPWLSHMLIDAAIFTIGYFIARSQLAPWGG
jgi:membrane protease YdiL (CAAX protease family)